MTFAESTCVPISEPEVNPVPPAVCEFVNTSNCESVTFTGMGFDNGDSYTCIIQHYGVCNVLIITY